MSDAAERAWEGWMELHTPIDHTRREAFLAGWAAREAIELEMAKADATEIATLIARRTMVETELAQARELLAAGQVERAARLLQRALSLTDSLPPLLEDLTPAGEETGAPPIRGDSDSTGAQNFAPVCDSCERPVRAGWPTCPFCGAGLVG